MIRQSDHVTGAPGWEDVLAHIRQHGPVTATDLARDLSLGKTAVGRVLKVLTQANRVDRRQEIHRTPSGTAYRVSVYTAMPFDPASPDEPCPVQGLRDQLAPAERALLSIAARQGQVLGGGSREAAVAALVSAGCLVRRPRSGYVPTQLGRDVAALDAT